MVCRTSTVFSAEKPICSKSDMVSANSSSYDNDPMFWFRVRGLGLGTGFRVKGIHKRAAFVTLNSADERQFNSVDLFVGSFKIF